jgi:hypothetical protein
MQGWIQDEREGEVERGRRRAGLPIIIVAPYPKGEG